jgi:hypothetical protein
MDSTLRGWAKLDTAAGESAIQNNVTWGIANYTDATARQYLIDTYHWTINGGKFDDSKTQQGTDGQDFLAVDGALVFVFVFPTVKSSIKSLPAFSYL